MEKQITEVLNYFTNKIINCDFKLLEIKTDGNNWFKIYAEIDEKYHFEFSIEPTSKLYCFHPYDSFMKIEIPKSKLGKLIKLVNQSKKEATNTKILELQKQLKELQ